MEIYKAALIHTFGRSATRPLRAALGRVTGLFCAATGLSILLAGNLAELPASQTFPEWRIAMSVLMAGEAVTMFVLCTATGLIRTYGTFEHMLLYWPIKSSVRWRALLLPGCLLAGLTTILISAPLGVVSGKMGLDAMLFSGALIGGGVLGLCTYYALKPRHIILQQIAVLALLVLEYKSIDVLATGGVYARVATITLWVAGAAIVGWYFIQAKRQLAKDITGKSSGSPIRFSYLTTYIWFTKKLWRTAGALLSLGTTCLLAIGAAVILKTNPEYQLFGSFLAALLAATTASDIRSLASRCTPPEIIALRGTGYFLHHYLLTGFAAAALASLPIIIVMPLSLLLVAEIALGLSIGIFAGTLIVPTNRDIAGQCLATLLCTGLLLVPTQMPFLLHTGEVAQAAAYAGTGILFILASIGIEYKRNNYRWRTHAA